MSDKAFDQGVYWITRHSKYPGESRAVGNLGQSNEENLRGASKAIETARYFYSVLKPKTILDVGCGFGTLSQIIMDNNIEYTGVDVSPIAINIAKKRHPNHNFIEVDILDWSSNNRYDVIYCMYTLAHFVDEGRFVSVLSRLLPMLTDSGSLVIIDDIRRVRSKPAGHVIVRTFSDYEAVSADVGLAFTLASRDTGFARRPYPTNIHEAIVGTRKSTAAGGLGATSSSGVSVEPEPPAVETVVLTMEKPTVPKSPADHAAIAGSLASERSPVGLLNFAKERVLDVSERETLREPGTSSGREQRTSMVVVSWDMAHNPAGRGFWLAEMANEVFDVEFIGPIFSKFGSSLWGPLKAQEGFKIDVFHGGDLAQYFRQAIEVVKRRAPPFVLISKPRLPSFLLGVLFKLIHGSTFILDIDDHELSFCAERTPLGLADALELARKDPAAAKMPFADVWTRLTESFVGYADVVTVSNPALQAKFGGVMVRHGRSERTFVPDASIRKRVRAEFNLSDSDIAVVFIGTPRPHKGIFRIADALERLNNPNLVFVVIGTINDVRVSKLFDKYKKARLKLFPDYPWERLPELISMADVVPILQDVGSPISEFQIPAKLTDALAMGVPILVTPVPPLVDLVAQGAVTPIETDEQLDKALASAVNFEALDKKYKARIRGVFLSEFGYGTNSARIKVAADMGRDASDARSIAAMRNFVHRLADHLEIRDPEFDQLVRRYPGRRPSVQGNPLRKDVVFFWKQNDSDIYGRRSDMMIKYLAERDDVRRVLVFDRPVSVSDLDRNLDGKDGSHLHQGNLVYVNTVRRILRMNDSPKVFRRTFLYKEGPSNQQRFGLELPARTGYVPFIQRSMKEAGMDGSAIAWVCPVVFDFPEIYEQLDFSRVIVDIIDDQRKWPAKADYLRRVEDSYSKVLSVADLVICNCEPVREGFRHLQSDIAVVPNGAEVFSPDHAWPRPEDLRQIPRPIVGYVGNLRDRIDIDLLRNMATQHPEWSIVLVGSAHDAPDIIGLGRQFANVHLLGVRPYGEALNYIRAFDVAIVPHLKNDLSRNMNPLKLYVYYSLGVPVVSTAVENIGDVGAHILVAEDHARFVTGVENSLKRGDKPAVRDANAVGDLAWPSRIAAILERLDALER